MKKVKVIREKLMAVQIHQKAMQIKNENLWHLKYVIDSC